jgi:hypothetical protein
MGLMNRRNLFKKMPAFLIGGLASAASLPAAAGNSFKYVVPDNVKEINIKSYRDTKEVMDYNFSVTPKQSFFIKTL